MGCEAAPNGQSSTNLWRGDLSPLGREAALKPGNAVYQEE